MAGRSEKKLITAAAEWCRSVRASFGWSEADLVANCESAGYTLRFANGVPTVADIEALEAGAVKRLPRWLRYARYAVERAELSLEDRAYWPGPRSWFNQDETYGEDPFDCSYPLLFRDEYFFIEELNAMPEEGRRAVRRFIVSFNSPYVSSKQAVERLLSDLGVQFERPPADEEERLLLEAHRALPVSYRPTLARVAQNRKMIRVIRETMSSLDRGETDDLATARGELVNLFNGTDDIGRETLLAVARLASQATS